MKTVCENHVIKNPLDERSTRSLTPAEKQFSDVLGRELALLWLKQQDALPPENCSPINQLNRKSDEGSCELSPT